jgi:hypothetical protein
MAVIGHLCVIADDASLIVDILRKQQLANREKMNRPWCFPALITMQRSQPINIGHPLWTSLILTLQPQSHPMPLTANLPHSLGKTWKASARLSLP